MCKLGFSLTQSDIMELVKEFVEINNIINPFKDNCPGKDWLRGFVARNGISIEQETLISSTRKSATENPQTTSAEKTSTPIQQQQPAYSTALSQGSISDFSKFSKLMKEKPAPISGKEWILTWSLVDAPTPSSFTTPLSIPSAASASFKNLKEKVVKKRRKVDLKTKIISDEAYLEELE